MVRVGLVPPPLFNEQAEVRAATAMRRTDHVQLLLTTPIFFCAAQGQAPRCLDWKPLVKGLKGFCRIQWGSGQIVAEISIHVMGDRQWASPPSRAMLDSSGVALRDETTVTFATNGTRASWSRQVLAALRAAYPGAIPEPEPDSDELEAQEAIRWHRWQGGAA